MPSIDELTAALEQAVKDEKLDEVERVLSQLEEATKDWDSDTPLGVSDEEAKCESCGEVAPSPYGGAKTFSEADSLAVYNKEERAVSEQISMFHSLQGNIWRDEMMNLAAKIAATTTLIEDLAGRVQNPPEYKEKPLLERVKALVGLGEKIAPEAEEDLAAVEEALFLVREAVSSDVDDDDDDNALEEALAALNRALATDVGYKHPGHGNQKVHAGKNVAISSLRGEIRQARKKGHTSKAYRLTQEVNKLRGFKALGEKAKTKTEDGVAFPASDYAYVPEPDSPSTWKLRLTSTPGGGPDSKIVGAAIAAFSSGGFRGQKVQIPADDVAAVKARVRAAWKKVHPDMDPKDMPMHIKELAEAQLVDGVLTAFKDAAGNWRWFSTATNKFKDREGEIFAEAAHKEFLGHLGGGGEYPTLRVWHTPGADIGQAEWVDYVDGFMVYAGRFSPGEEAVAERLAALGPQGVSHGYKYLAGDKANGIYTWYRTFEVTILPPHRAANQWGVGTAVIGSKEDDMPFTKEKRDYLLEVFGDEERVRRIEKVLSTLGKELEGKVAFKDLAEAVQEPDPEPKPEPNGDGEPEPEPEEPTAEARISALETQVGQISSRVEELVGSTKELTEGIKVLLKSDEEKIADALAPRRPAPRPTENTGNIVEAAKEAAGDGEPEPQNPVSPYLKQLGVGVEQEVTS